MNLLIALYKFIPLIRSGTILDLTFSCPQPPALLLSHNPGPNYFFTTPAPITLLSTLRNRLLNNGITWRGPVFHRSFVLLFYALTRFSFVSNRNAKVSASILSKKN